MAKKDFLRTRSSTSRLVDADLKISGSFMLPLAEENDEPLENAIAVQEGKLVLHNGVDWEEISGGIDADNIDETLRVDPQTSLLGVDLSKVTSRNDFDTLVGALVPHPTYNAPTAAATTSATLVGEIGTPVNSLVVNVAFTQRDAGQASGFQVKKNGDVVAIGNSYTDSLVLAAAAVTYQGTVSYYDGPVKQNIIGINDPVGRILAGSVASNTLSFIGYYYTWFGAAAGIPANSAAARALTGKQLSNASNTFILNTGSTQTIMAIITAPGKSLGTVVDLDALNAVITSEYVLQGAFAMNDAAGNAITGCKLYVKQMGVAYSTSHRHQVTLV